MRKQLLDIDRSLTELTFDKDKAVVLTMLLGPKFTNALDIVMNLEITGDLSNLIITPVAKRDVPHLLSKWDFLKRFPVAKSRTRVGYPYRYDKLVL